MIEKTEKTMVLYTHHYIYEVKNLYPYDDKYLNDLFEYKVKPKTTIVTYDQKYKEISFKKKEYLKYKWQVLYYPYTAAFKRHVGTWEMCRNAMNQAYKFHKEREELMSQIIHEKVTIEEIEAYYINEKEKLERIILQNIIEKRTQ